MIKIESGLNYKEFGKSTLVVHFVCQKNFDTNGFIRTFKWPSWNGINIYFSYDQY